MSGLDTELLIWINMGWAHPWLDIFFIWISERETFSLPLTGILLHTQSPAVLRQLERASQALGRKWIR